MNELLGEELTSVEVLFDMTYLEEIHRIAIANHVKAELL